MERCFLGMEVVSPWPKEFPEGRILREEDRHLTLAFLGQVDLSSFISQLSLVPLPSFQIGIAGWFDRAIFLPQKKPRTAGYHVQFFDRRSILNTYQAALIAWLKNKNVPVHARPVSHVTIARAPFLLSAWKEQFSPLPVYFRKIALYESFSGSHYRIRWSYSLLPPFEEREHTADLAFLIRGASLLELYLHAALALAFVFPPFVPFLYARFCDEEHPLPLWEKEGGASPENDLQELVKQLNKLVAIVDAEKGCPFKAVSFHGKIERTLSHLLEWEMIVDV